jgi:clan AA aspartic protease
MGLTSKKLIVKKSYETEKSVEISFLVDSGAVFSLVPGKLLDELGIKPHRKVDFSLADGTIISRHVGDAYFELNGEGSAAPVIYGEEGDDALLGATTLESLGLVLNPFTRELYPMRMLMAIIRPAGGNG